MRHSFRAGIMLSLVVVLAACGPTTRAISGVRLERLDGGRPLRLGSVHGPVVLLVWAQWCPPCRAEAPIIAEVVPRLEARGITPLSAEHEYICTVPSELPQAQATEVLTVIDRLEQEDDVQKVFHTLA